MAKKGEFVLSIGDDNVILTRFVDKKIVNAWLASPDPATAIEELGEALGEDKKGKISLIIDTLDQAFKEEEIPKVGILDRRKVLSRHITMAFPGQTMRGARLVGDGKSKKSLLYEFASVPLDGRIPGWLEFYESLPNQRGGVFSLASENVDMIAALAPKDAPVEQGNHWQHMIGVNVTGGLRQIIAKNGRLSLTRLTQAPPPETPPEEFADMIIRDFKATITYLRRLGYVVGDPLDLVVLTTADNRLAMDKLEWDGARSVTILTPYEAGATLGLGAVGPEDQAHCDVLHAAWFSHKPRPALPLTRSVAMGDAKDDIRELAFAISPFAAGIAVATLVTWTGYAVYEYFTYTADSEIVSSQLASAQTSLAAEQQKLGELPYQAAVLRNAFDVESAMDKGSIDMLPPLRHIFSALQNDAIVLDISIVNKGLLSESGSVNSRAANYEMTVRMRMADVVVTAKEAVEISRSLLSRLIEAFGPEYKVEMTQEPVGLQSNVSLQGGLLESDVRSDSESAISTEPFLVEFAISRGN